MSKYCPENELLWHKFTCSGRLVFYLWFTCSLSSISQLCLSRPFKKNYLDLQNLEVNRKT